MRLPREYRCLAAALALAVVPAAGCDDDGAAKTATKSSTPSSGKAAGGSEVAATGEPAGAADTAETTDAEPSDAKGIFYRVSGQEGTAYVLGSVHVAKPELYPLRDEIRDAFAQSDALSLELRMDQGALGAMAQKLLAAAKYPPGETLEQHLSPKTRKLYEQHKSEAGPMAAMLGQFKPWFVAMTLVSTVLQQHGYSEQDGIDMHFQKQIGDKKSIPLETVDQQLSLFESLDEETQDLMLRETLEDIDEVADDMNEAFDAWKKGDAEAIEKIVLDMKGDDRYEGLYEQLIVRRNERMADKIDGLLKDGHTLFVVVGSAHVVGEDGVVAQLGEKGYETEQL